MSRSCQWVWLEMVSLWRAKPFASHVGRSLPFSLLKKLTSSDTVARLEQAGITTDAG